MATRRVLIAGVFLTDHPNRIEESIETLAESTDWDVHQQWIALGRSDPPMSARQYTVGHVHDRLDKFVLVNRILSAEVCKAYDYIMVCDDDIEFPAHFIDRYLGLVDAHEFALAQPARTHDSSIDHVIVQQLDGVDARQTRFIEIGPCFSMRRDAAAILVPFDEQAPMGWGADFVWPCLLERCALKLGVVDATPVAHRLRKTVSLYDRTRVDKELVRYLDGRPHLSVNEAFVVIEAYAGQR